MRLSMEDMHRKWPPSLYPQYYFNFDDYEPNPLLFLLKDIDPRALIPGKNKRISAH